MGIIIQDDRFSKDTFCEIDISKIQEKTFNDIKNKMLSENFDLSGIQNGSDLIIEEVGIKFILTSLENQKKNIENDNMTKVNLSDCEIELRKKDNISGDIFMLKVDKEQSGYKIPKIEYEVFAVLNSDKLEQLNLDICEGLNASIYIPVNKSENECEKNDLNGGFYHNICYAYSVNGSVDVPLIDRKNVFIENNLTICEENCEFERCDYTIGKAICSCMIKIKMPLISEISFDKNIIIDKFKNFKSLANINILKCYYLIYNKNLIKNIGFITFCPVIIFYIISIFIFWLKDIKKIYKIIKDIKVRKKDQGNQKKKDIKKNLSKKRTENPPLKKVKSKKIPFENNFSLGRKNKIQRKKQAIKLNKSESKNRMNTDVPEINLKNNKNNDIMEYNTTELNLLLYKEAKKLDKRTYCQYYLNLVVYKNMLFFTFYLTDDYNSKIMKINLFIYMFIVHFGVNALFFSDSTMHQIYEDKGNFIIIYQIPNIIYSFIVSTAFNTLLKFLSLTESNIIKLKKKESKIENESKKIKKNIKIKFILFFIFSFVVLIFVGFYLACFCAVYKNTQKHLIKDTLISFCTSFITPFFFNLIPGMMRIPALKSKKNKRYQYNFSKLLQII